MDNKKRAFEEVMNRLARVKYTEVKQQIDERRNQKKTTKKKRDI